MGYDRSDSFPFDFEPNRIQFGSINGNRLIDIFFKLDPFGSK